MTTVRKWLMGLMVITTGFILTACGSTQSSEDDSWKKVKDKNELIVATSGTLFPSSYYNDENELSGYDVDVAKAVAKKLDLKIKFKEYNVDGQVTAVNRGEADFAANDLVCQRIGLRNFHYLLPLNIPSTV